MNLLPPAARSLVFRIVGYTGLAAIAVITLLSNPGVGGGWLLLIFAVGWPPVTFELQRSFRQPAVPLSLHAIECFMVPSLVLAVQPAGLVSYFAGLILLVGAAAEGGFRYLLTSAVSMVASMILFGGHGLSGPDRAMESISFAVLCVFVVGIALASHHQVRRQYSVKVAAVGESVSLLDANARLERYLPEDVRRVVAGKPANRQRPVSCWATVVFIDVVGFTELVDRRSMAEVIDIVDDYLLAMVPLVETHHGVLGKFLGDGLLVYYADDNARHHIQHSPPHAEAGGSEDTTIRVDDAVAAARLSLATPPLMREVSANWHRRGVIAELRTRVGIASGYCAIGDWGAHGRLDYTLIGAPVNLASRLQARAPVGGILVSAATAALISQEVSLATALSPTLYPDIQGLGRVQAHGLDQPTASANVPAQQTTVDSRLR